MLENKQKVVAGYFVFWANAYLPVLINDSRKFASIIKILQAWHWNGIPCGSYHHWCFAKYDLRTYCNPQAFYLTSGKE